MRARQQRGTHRGLNNRVVLNSTTAGQRREDETGEREARQTLADLKGSGDGEKGDVQGRERGKWKTGARVCVVVEREHRVRGRGKERIAL